MNKNRLSKIFTTILLFMVLSSVFSFIFSDRSPVMTVSYSDFYKQLEENKYKNIEINVESGYYKINGEYKEPVVNDKNQSVNWSSMKIEGEKVSKFTANVPKEEIENIQQKIKDNGLVAKLNPQTENLLSAGNILNFVFLILPIALIGWYMFKMMKEQSKITGSGNDKVKKVTKSDVRFDDVAGYKEEKKELIEIVDFLKNPAKYSKMGARIPKGILLEGPPGTGKTLLAKAVAGESGVNFIMQSGSEFVEMFVGVGAKRARKLFDDAKKNAPCIIFIDEIDAIGRKRGSGNGGGNDEREQTLNQILIEMDGFVRNSGIVVMAATNRADVLDPALLRPGRFDRKVKVNLPDVKEREAILKLHSSRRNVSPDVEIKEVAKNTSGFSGAQLENVMNEAAIIAVREGKDVINKLEISEGIDRVLMGPAKKTRKYTPEDKKLIAYHETGHVVIGLELEDADVIQKVTIIPRGDAGGYAMHSPKEDRFNYTRTDLIEKITGLLGGRAAESTFLDIQSAGAHNDFERATKIARSMVVEYGMSDLGVYQLMHREDYEAGYRNKGYSEETAEKIDFEINKILTECYENAVRILKERKADVDLIADTLTEVETLERPQIDFLIKNRRLPSDEELIKIEAEINKEKEEELFSDNDQDEVVIED